MHKKHNRRKKRSMRKSLGWLERIMQSIKQKTKRVSRVGWILGGIVMLVIVSSFGYATYAKYFSESAKAGIAVASGIYFTANYAVHTTEEGSFFESMVSSNYTGGTFNFDFEVRNFENNLLFNDSGVVIPYSVSFWLGETPVSANYTVRKPDGEAMPIGVGEEGKYTFSGQSIAGGAAITDIYTISIGVFGGAGTHTAVPIYVQVITDDGAIVNRNLCGKMVLNNIARPENFIEAQQFVLPGFEGTDEEKYAELLKQTEFMYEIRTVGQVLNSDEVIEELKVSWNPNVLSPNLFNEAYQDWMGRTGNNAPLVDSNTGWNYFTIKVMPYSSETIGFFRGSGFDSNVSDMDGLNAAVVAEKYTAG